MSEDYDRILVLADIHGNLEAVSSILREVDHDVIIFLGDIVSFGSDPHLCIDLLREQNCFLALKGNHDNAVLNKDGDCKTLPSLKPLSSTTREYARKVLNKDQMTWLSNLKHSSSFALGDYSFYAVHGSPKDPLFGELSLDASDSQLMIELNGIKEQNVLCAHTHVPFIRMLPTGITIINPGSVGLPLDGNNKASCVLIDLLRSYNQILRIRYDISKTIQRLKAAALPPDLVKIVQKGTY